MRVVTGAQGLGRGLPGHAARSLRPARLSTAGDTRTAARGRPEVCARIGVAAVPRPELADAGTAPRLRPSAAGVPGVPALQEAAPI